MKKTFKQIAGLFLSFGLGALMWGSIGLAVAAIYDPRGDFGAINWFRSGVLEFVQQMDGDNGALAFHNTDAPTPSDVAISSYNAIRVGRATTAEIGALDPVQEGELIWNSDRNVLCVSTGVATGSWGLVSGISTHTAAIYAGGISSATTCGPGT